MNHLDDPLLEDDSLDFDLFAEDLQSEELPTADSLIATCGTFACGGCASCPVGTASTAGSIGCAC